MFTFSRNGELAESASSSGRYARRPSQTWTARSGAVDRDVDVEAERVVPPDDVAQQLVAQAVVRRVDDPLLLPRAPRMRAGRAERDAELRRRARCSWARRLGISAAASAKVSQRPVRTSTSDAISSPTRCGSSSVPSRGSLQLLEAVRRARGVSGSRIANSSSTATVKSVADSYCSRPSRSCSSPLRTLLLAPRREVSRRARAGVRATPAQLQRSTTARRAARGELALARPGRGRAAAAASRRGRRSRRSRSS